MKSTNSVRQLRIAKLGVVVAALALLASCAEPPPPKVAEAPLSVGLPAKLVEAASVYEAYVDKAALVTPDFADGEEVAAKLKSAAAYEPVQFQRGAAAYAAIVAMQDPAFIAGVRAYAADPNNRLLVINEIMKDPAYVVGIKGSDSAAGLVIAALDAQGVRVRTAGERIKQAAYDVQKKPWSKATVADREGRLAAVKALSASPYPAAMESSARLRLASAGPGQSAMTFNGSPLPPPYTPTVVRGMAVAALAILGQASEADTDTLWAVLNEPNQALCLSMAKLNVNQCLAVSKPYYEDVFCLGVHVLMDTGSCVIKGAGAPKPLPALIASAAPATATAAPTAGTAQTKIKKQ